MRLNLMTLMMCFLCSPILAQEPAAEADDTALPAESQDKPLDFWMGKKLEYSTGIMKGLALGDFDLIETNAGRMRLLNKIEGFVRHRNGEYRTNLQTFERVTDDVIYYARKENIDGVTLAYHQLTVSCVRCHQTLREGRAQSDPTQLPGIH